jgi:hypothetical protein
MGRVASTLISTHLSRASAALLLAGGLSLLFASDHILPRLVPAFPRSAAWIGQLLAAAWLAVAALNWHHRSMLLGGIYGRGVVTANAVLFFMSATSLFNIVRSNGERTVWVLFVPAVIFAAAYGWLLFRGPFARDFELSRRSQ